MSGRAVSLAVVSAQVAPAQGDWRIERMAALVATVALGEEWDQDRLLVVPRPGGLLCPLDVCSVAGCESLVDGASALCHAHGRQLAASGVADIDVWLASGAPCPPQRRYLAEEVCSIVGADGSRCGRPAFGAERFCHTHSTGWKARSRSGISFEEFLARAAPLDSLGTCAVASCYLMACYKQSRLCGMHYDAWSQQGRPRGRRLAAFLARAGQPANARVLSLRGLPVLVRLELLYAIGCRRHEQIRTSAGVMRSYVDRLRAEGVASLIDIDPARIDPTGRAHQERFARFAFDRVRLAYADPQSERQRDIWDLRVFGRSGRLDFSPISQVWLAEATKSWAATRLTGPLARSAVSTVQHQLHSVRLMSAVLASGPGGGHDPAALGRADVERFLARVSTLACSSRDRSRSPFWVAGIVQDCARFLREAREMGLLVGLAPTFAIRRGEEGHRVDRDGPGRALPAHVVAQLDIHTSLLAEVPGSLSGPAHRNRGVLGERAGEMAVLVYELLKGTGRRAGEVASLHLDCLDVDEAGQPVLIYDNHKAARMGRRLPLSDASLVGSIRAQQAWVAQRFPHTARQSLWLLPRAAKNDDGTAHIDAELIAKWMRSWVSAIPRIDAGTFDEQGEPLPFDRKAIHPHAFRHTYAQTLADQGVAAPVLRDLMDHHSIDTTMGYYRVADAKKRAAMELLARHTLDNRGTARPVPGAPSNAARLRDEISWVAVPFGKCAEPTNVRAGGGACPIRYQCAACPHFQSDPSYLPELASYADDLRRQREAMLAIGAPGWAVNAVSGQLEVIVGHLRSHQQTLARLPADQRDSLQEASATLRKARQAVPVAFGRRRSEAGHD